MFFKWILKNIFCKNTTLYRRIKTLQLRYIKLKKNLYKNNILNKSWKIKENIPYLQFISYSLKNFHYETLWQTPIETLFTMDSNRIQAFIHNRTVSKNVRRPCSKKRKPLIIETCKIFPLKLYYHFTPHIFIFSFYIIQKYNLIWDF